MKPRVTIGLCVKNCEASIKEVINSILDQNFPHERVEVIFVDDGSEDGTLSLILDSIPEMDMEVKVFHSKWKGLGPARNTVVDNTSGDYIIWVDGDMILPRDHLRKQVEFMENNPAVGIGKAKEGISNGISLVATLENIERVVWYSKLEGKPTSKELGTGGSIYRVEAIRKIGGFDEDIKGSCEDIDAEYRIRTSGFLLQMTSALFYERHKATWRSLWDKYFWYGYGEHFVRHKNKGVSSPYRTTVFNAILIAFSRSITAYKLTCRKAAFLLSFHYVFKRIAWFLGFAKSHVDGYGHGKSDLKRRRYCYG